MAKFDLVIAIDGTAASGKGTISKKIAQNYSVPHLDTGLLYRFVGFKVLKGFDPERILSGLECVSSSELQPFYDILNICKVLDAQHFFYVEKSFFFRFFDFHFL